MSYIILITIIIVLISKNRELKKEIANLRESLDNKDFSSSQEQDYPISENNLSYNQEVEIETKPEPVTYNNEPEVKVQKVIKKTSTLTKEEQKNNMILITGAILIVLSAIIFLLSTWMSTGNITKTLIIFLMLVVFFVISKISDSKFKLKQTSEVFLYISLCYLPIAFLSISLFSLFGHYLSLFGSGKYIYLAISSIITSISYIIVKEKHDSLFLKTLTELFLLISVVFSSLIVTSNIFYIEIILIMYIIIREYITIKKNNITNRDKATYLTLTMLSIMGISSLISNITTTKIVPIELPIYLTLLLLNAYILINKIIKKESIYNYIYPISIILIFISIANVTLFEFSLIVKHIIILLSTILLYGYEIITSKEIKITTLVSASVVTGILCLALPAHNFIKVSGVLLVYVIFMVVNYIINDKNKNITSYFLTISSLLLSLSIINDFNLPWTLAILVSEIPLVLSRYYSKLDNYLKQSFYNVGIVSLCLSIICVNSIELSYINTISTLLGSIILLLHFLGNQKDINKYLSYLIFTLSMVLLFENIGIEHSEAYAISFATLIITLLESTIDIFKSNNSSYYIIVSSVISFALLNINLNITKFIILLILNIALIYYNIANKKDDNMYILCSLSLIHSIFLSDILIIEDLNVMILIDFLLIAVTTILSYNKREINQFTIIAYVYILCSIIFLEISPYINHALLIVPSLIHITSNEGKSKDLFKLVLYTTILLLIKNILKDLELTDVSVLNIGSTLIYAIIIIRDVIKKYTQNYKALEYFALSIINLIAIANYNSEFDGIMYVSLLVILIIIGYNCKFGPTFLTSLIFVVINALVLTREFWLSIPWWIYVLATGIILVLFAVRNEATNNETRSKVKELKEDLDL